MQIHFLVFTLIATQSVLARRLTFNDNANPVRTVDTSYGQGNHERVDVLVAEIYPRHVTNGQRIDFPRSGPLNEYFLQAREDGDERGHLVASQFSGPREWYNLSAQNSRVNRNMGYQSLTTGWYETECEVRRFLDGGGTRWVRWRVEMTYVADSNRPDEYRLLVDFMENGQNNRNGIDTRIRNPFLREDSTFWICRSDRGNNCNNQCSRA